MVIIIWVASITVASPLIVVNDVERMPGLVHIDYPNWLAACKEVCTLIDTYTEINSMRYIVQSMNEVIYTMILC